MPGPHAQVSPSAAYRWISCPGSVALCKGLPDDEGSVYAMEGTIAHHMAELILTGQKPEPDDAETEFLYNNKIDLDELLKNVRYYTDYVNGLIEGEGVDVFVEQRLDLESVTGETGAGGTSDCVILRPKKDGSRSMFIIDLKYGTGEKIDAPNNSQLAIYARAAYNYFSMLYDISTVYALIIQPRLDHISEWALSPAELTQFTDEISAAAAKALAMCDQPFEKWEFNPSVKACHYCKARGHCAALSKYCLSAAGVDVLGQRNAPRVDAESIAAILDKMPLIEKWIGFIKEKALNMLLSGLTIPGYKCVRGKPGPRKWKDEKAAEAALIDLKLNPGDMYDMKVISPTSAEKLVKKKLLTDQQFADLGVLIDRSEGKPNLATADDPRAEYTPMTEEDFPDESQPANEDVKDVKKKNQEKK